MQPPFWLNAAPRPIPVLPNSCMGGLHLAKRGAAFFNFLYMYDITNSTCFVITSSDALVLTIVYAYSLSLS